MRAEALGFFLKRPGLLLSRQYRAFNQALASLYGDGLPATFADDKKRPAFDDKKFFAMAKRIFQERGFNAFQLATAEGQALIAETFGVLRDAISSSITYEVPEILTYALENNAFVFSGFKTFHAIREVGLSLTDSDGSIKPFERFLNDVRKINDRYNHNYLRAEYNQAVAASQMAARWHQFEQDGDDYYLQYRTAGDANVREEHAILHNTTLPISDPFWAEFLPPNGWNCRCTAVQVRKDKYPMSDPELAMKRGRNCTDGAKRQIFRFNPGKTMRLFPERHPYMPKGCGSCDKRLNLAYNPIDPKCQICDEIRRQAAIAQNRAKYNQLLHDANYQNVVFDEKNGGLKANHKGHNFDKKGGVYERHVQDAGFKSGHAVILENEYSNVLGQRFTEGTWDNMKFEVAGCETGTTNNIMRGLKHCASKRTTEIAVIDLPNTAFDFDTFSSALRRYKGLEKLGDGQFIKFKKIICVHNEEIVYAAEL